MKSILVSNRLPVKIIVENDDYQFIPSEGGLATGLGDVYRKDDSMWVGWPGISVPEHRQAEVTERLAQLNLFPVFLTEEEINLYYEGFCNEILWPVFHYFVTYANFEQRYWESYQAVNRKFASAVLKVAGSTDVIWVQDYQLLLLPCLLRSAIKTTTIGFFQHIPFPSYEIFRLIPWRKELVKGLLGADLIGFHTYDDVKHFLDTAVRLLPISSLSNVMATKDRQLVVEAFPMGIDYEKFSQIADTDEVMAEVERFNETRNHLKTILSIDRLDYSKGIYERLKAFELLLDTHPEYIEKISLYMIVVPSRSLIAQYHDLKDRIDQLVGNINAKYRTVAWNPINYFYRSFPINSLSTFYATADICLVTPMRDGMNLVSKEYVATRNKEDGVLILSEVAGASKELADALMVNPNDIKDIKNAILTALEMPLAEQRQRMSAMREIVKKFNVIHWVNNFMTKLKEVKNHQYSLLTKYAMGESNAGILDKYKNAKSRTLFLDYDGTLVGFKGDIDDASPNQELYDLLKKLTDDPANHVVIISGRNYQTLEKWFGGLNVDLIAEHGAWNRNSEGTWNSLPLLTDQWKMEMISLLTSYTDKTPGAFVEEKSYSLVWHYRKADEGLGELRANEIVSNLKSFATDKGLQVMLGNKVIEFKNIEVNKGKAALSWLYGKETEFVFAVGDDRTDEDIFRSLPEDAITIKVGNSPSEAKYFLYDFLEVRNLLEQLADSGS